MDSSRSAAVKENGGDVDCEDFRHPVDVEEFRKQAYQMVDFMCDYYKGLDQVDVLSAVQPGYLREKLPAEAPQQGQSFASIIKDVATYIMPGMTHWQSPNFFAYYPANSSFPGMLGEMLSAALNVIGFSWRGCPAATDLETVVLDWAAKLFNLPAGYLAAQEDGGRGKGGGCIQGTASEACLVALLAGRARMLESRSPEDSIKLVAYCSDQAHSCVKKACMIAGIHHLRVLPTTAESGWRLMRETVETQLRADEEAGLIPFFLCGSVGTTSTAAVDPIRELGELSRSHSLWLHIDAAYAGVAAILPECATYFDGLELADSFNTNAHKWLLTNFDCSLLFVQDSFHLKKALTLNPAFLQNTTNEYDYKDWQVPLGRRFRSLKLWFVLRTYGKEGLQKYLRHHIALAQQLAKWIEQDQRFELATEQQFSLVCFTLKGKSNEDNKALLEAVNATGRTFIIHTELDGKVVLRVAIGAASTQLSHVQAVWDLIRSKADSLQG